MQNATTAPVRGLATQVVLDSAARIGAAWAAGEEPHSLRVRVVQMHMDTLVSADLWELAHGAQGCETDDPRYVLAVAALAALTRQLKACDPRGVATFA